jgi:hypothetical protein
MEHLGVVSLNPFRGFSVFAVELLLNKESALSSHLGFGSGYV